MLQWPLLLSKKKKEPNERVRQTSHPSVYYWPALPLLLNPVSVTLRVRVTALTDTEQIMLSHVISSEHRALKGFFFHIKSIQSHFSQLFQGATVSLTCFVKTAAMQQTVSGNLIGSHGDQIQNRDNCGCEEKKTGQTPSCNRVIVSLSARLFLQRMDFRAGPVYGEIQPAGTMLLLYLCGMKFIWGRGPRLGAGLC